MAFFGKKVSGRKRKKRSDAGKRRTAYRGDLTVAQFLAAAVAHNKSVGGKSFHYGKSK